MKTEKQFVKITGGKKNTPTEVFGRFPWLKGAEFYGAVVDISNFYLIWEDGIWKGGTWKYGIWKGGIWEDGIWKDGIWEDGYMWDNISQSYVKVKFKDGKFERVG